MSNLWIFTPDGFYSSRQDAWCEDDEVMVRARVYEDLLALADVIGMEDPQIVRIPKGDYLYRMKVKQSDWNMYCAHAAMNHQDDGGIKDVEDMDRYIAYLRIWEIMSQLQDLKDAEKRGNKNEEDEQRDVLYDMCWPEHYDHYNTKDSKPTKIRTSNKGIWLDGYKPRKLREDEIMADFNTSNKIREERRKKQRFIEDYLDDPFFYEKGFK